MYTFGSSVRTIWVVLFAALTIPFISGCAGPKPVIGNQTGNLAPDIKLRDAEGNMHTLKDLRGKMVLVEFWEANNAESRRNHFVLQQLYAKYKDVSFNAGTGFTIFSISLDNDTHNWQQAVKEDGLTFPDILNDTGGWSAQSVLDYKVATLPQYYLINEKGIIIQHHILLPDLERTLEENK